MEQKVIAFNKTQKTKEIPDLRAGDVVKIHLKIKEGEKERTQIFEGLIIAMKGAQSSSPTLTVRKVSNGVGVELILPVFGKNVEKVELVKRAKVRRAKLYYVRELTAKQSRMKYRDMAKYAKDEKNTEEELKKQNDTEKKKGAEETQKEQKNDTEEMQKEQNDTEKTGDTKEKTEEKIEEKK